ncbi:hypothetical protein BTVI_90403 [Pitangus sulphuratus]|nr:hypothetical protein BTVI_90403 [Pitangus sulphuratus]
MDDFLYRNEAFRLHLFHLKTTSTSAAARQSGYCVYCGFDGEEPVPASSKTDLVVAKTDRLERRVRICERNNSADTKASEEEGEGSAPGARAEIPLQPLVQPMVTQADAWSPWRSMGEQRSTSGEPDARAGGCLKEAVTLREACAGAGFW